MLIKFWIILNLLTQEHDLDVLQIEQLMNKVSILIIWLKDTSIVIVNFHLWMNTSICILTLSFSFNLKKCKIKKKVGKFYLRQLIFFQKKKSSISRWFYFEFMIRHKIYNTNLTNVICIDNQAAFMIINR